MSDSYIPTPPSEWSDEQKNEYIARKKWMEEFNKSANFWNSIGTLEVVVTIRIAYSVKGGFAGSGKPIPIAFATRAEMTVADKGASARVQVSTVAELNKTGSSPL